MSAWRRDSSTARGLTWGGAHIDVAESGDFLAFFCEQILDLTAARLGALQQAAEIDHLHILIYSHWAGVNIDVIPGHVFPNIEMGHAAFIELYVDGSRGVDWVDLDIVEVEAGRLQMIENALAIAILPHTGKKPHRKSQIFKMTGKIERRAADALVVRKDVD